MSERNMPMRCGRLVALAVGFSLLGACSHVPDAVNPVEWYKSSVEYVTSSVEYLTGDDKQTTQADNTLAKDGDKEAPTPGADKKFPTIASVDQQRDYYDARKGGGLVADTEGRKYAPAPARQDEASSGLAASPPAELKIPMTTEPATTEPATTEPATTEQARMASSPAEPEIPMTTEPATTQQIRLVPPSVLPAAAGNPVNTQLPSMNEHQAFQARLQRRLNEIRARAGQPPLELPGAGAMAADNFGTVIVNSTGISAAQTAALAPGPAMVPSQQLTTNPLTHLARPMQALSSGAVKVATIHFPNGSASLSPRDRQIIAEALQLKKERGGRIRIIGHASSRTQSTDPAHHKMLNFQVSVDRADAVARELRRLGMEKQDMLVDAISDSQPMYFEFMPAGEAGNRRAEIYLES